jgi:galactonate dehydratase
VPWRRELVRETLEFRDGELIVPSAPGLGVELNEEACENHPFVDSDMPLFDGTMNVAGIATGAAVVGSGQR